MCRLVAGSSLLPPPICSHCSLSLPPLARAAAKSPRESFPFPFLTPTRAPLAPDVTSRNRLVPHWFLPPPSPPLATHTRRLRKRLNVANVSARCWLVPRPSPHSLALRPKAAPNCGNARSRWHASTSQAPQRRERDWLVGPAPSCPAFLSPVRRRCDRCKPRNDRTCFGPTNGSPARHQCNCCKPWNDCTCFGPRSNNQFFCTPCLDWPLLTLDPTTPTSDWRLLESFSALERLFCFVSLGHSLPLPCDCEWSYTLPRASNADPISPHPSSQPLHHPSLDARHHSYSCVPLRSDFELR
jgi:hypothetical protein